jgi:hypothetical protein
VDEPCYGLIVEGPYDEHVYPALVRKILARDLRVIVRPCGGVSKLLSRLPGYLVELEHAWYGRAVDKALIIRDWSEADLSAGEQSMAKKIEGRVFSFPRGIQFCLIRQEMETLLLADGDAINAVAAERGGRAVSQLQGALEELRDPKQKLMKLLSEARLPYDAQVCGEIAQNASIERLRYRCPAFRSFEQKVIDC